jgi:hypothetical protein
MALGIRGPGGSVAPVARTPTFLPPAPGTVVFALELAPGLAIMFLFSYFPALVSFFPVFPLVFLSPYFSESVSFFCFSLV